MEREMQKEEVEVKEEFPWRRTQSIRTFRAMLERSGHVPFRQNTSHSHGPFRPITNQDHDSLHPVTNQLSETEGIMKPETFQTTPPNHDIFHTTPTKQKTTSPDYDIFQTTPPKLESITPNHDIFQSISFTHDIFQSMPPKQETTLPNHDIFQSMPPKQETTLPNHDIFQNTLHKQETTPTNHDIFQNTLHKQETTPTNHDNFHTTPSKQKTTSPNQDIFQTTSLTHDIFQTIPPKQETTPPTHDIFQTTSCTHDIFQTTTPKHDIFKHLPLKHEIFETTPQKQETTPPNHEMFQTTPYKHDIFQTTPPIEKTTPPNHDNFQTTPSKHDVFQPTTLKPGNMHTCPDIMKTTVLEQKQGTEKWNAEEYPFYENILLIGEEKCVEDWPEDSPELCPDWKPPGRFRLRRESLLVMSEGQRGLDEEERMKHANNYRMKKGRRFTLPITSSKSSKVVNDPTEKGADLFKGREGEEDEQTDMEEYRQQQKKGKKFKIHFLQRKDSKGVNDHTEKGADLFKGREGEEDEQTDMEEYRQQQKKGKKFKIHFLLQRDSKGVNDHTEKGADLFKGREGEEDEQTDMEEYRQQQNKGKRSKIHFLHPRDPNEFEVPETPPGATCSNYHLSEAAEAEWLSAQRDEVLMRGGELEDAVALEDGDTDSLMEWWNTVEQWDEVPSDEDSEKLPEEKELKQCKVLVEKVQKGIHVFNKVFMEQAEGLWQHVIDLNTVAENISEFHKKAKIASITGGTTSAVGGVTAIAGLALAPVTLGASLIITAVGIGVATAGGLTSASATISDTVNNSHDRRKVERIVQDYQAKMADVGKCLRYVQQGLERLQALSPALGPAHMPDPTLRRAVLMASEAGGTADRAVGIVSETGSELNSLSLGMDSYYAGNNSRELKKDCKTEFVYKIREVAEHLHQGLVELNRIREELHDAVYNI